MKFNPLSVASAFAIIVFEHPGGPNIKMPLGGVIPKRWNASGCTRGHSIACLIFNFSSCWPPISDHRTYRKRAKICTHNTIVWVLVLAFETGTSFPLKRNNYFKITRNGQWNRLQASLSNSSRMARRFDAVSKTTSRVLYKILTKC